MPPKVPFLNLISFEYGNLLWLTLIAIQVLISTYNIDDYGEILIIIIGIAGEFRPCLNTL